MPTIVYCCVVCVVVVVVIVVDVSVGSRTSAVDVYDDIGNDNEQQHRESSRMSRIMKPVRGGGTYSAATLYTRTFIVICFVTNCVCAGFFNSIFCSFFFVLVKILYCGEHFSFGYGFLHSLRFREYFFFF